MKHLLIAAALVCTTAFGAQAATRAPSASDALARVSHGIETGAVGADWSRMTRRQMRRKRMMRNNRMDRRMMRRGGASASPSAPNGRGIGMGPTGQPSGVK